MWLLDTEDKRRAEFVRSLPPGLYWHYIVLLSRLIINPEVTPEIEEAFSSLEKQYEEWKNVQS